MFDPELMKRAEAVKEAFDPILGGLLGAGIGAARAPEGQVGRGAGRGGILGAGTGLGMGVGGTLGTLGGGLLGAGLGGLTGNPDLSVLGLGLGAMGGGLGGTAAGGYGGYKLTKKMMGPAPWDQGGGQPQKPAPAKKPAAKKPDAKKKTTKEAAAGALLKLLGA